MEDMATALYREQHLTRFVGLLERLDNIGSKAVRVYRMHNRLVEASMVIHGICNWIRTADIGRLHMCFRAVRLMWYKALMGSSR